MDVRTDRGQIAPALVLVVLALLGAGFALFQVGRASVLQAKVTTSADAAALAAAEELKRQLIEQLKRTGFNEPEAVNPILMERAAREYAGRNGGRLRDFKLLGLKVFVDVDTVEQLDGAGGLPQTAGQRGRQTAWAEVVITYAFGPPPGGGGVPLGGGAPGTDGRGGNVDDYISALAPAMQEDVRKLNEAMGGTLQITSGYRSAAYQAELCKRVAGPCAAPGQSMHQYGLAIDVANHEAALAAIEANPDIGLCQPLPANDAVHFSHVTGRECGGSTGRLGPGALFGGDIANFAVFDTRLVDGP